MPLETIYAYDGTDVTIIYVSNGYIRQSRPGCTNKNDGYKGEGSGKIGRGLVIDGTAKTPMDLPIPDPESEYLNKIYLVGENLYVCVGLKNGEGFTPNFAWRKVGPACPKGDDAYTIWRNNQIEAGVNEDQILTEEQWLESLKGKDGVYVVPIGCLKD